MPDPGGISVCAGGGIRIAADAGEAFAYLKATSGGKTPDDVLRAFAQGMVELPEYMERLVAVNGAQMIGIGRTREGNYPFPGTGTLQFIDIESVPGFDATQSYPHAIVNRSRSKSSSGANLFKVLQDNLERRPIDVRLATPAKRLVTDGRGAVTGVVVESGGRVRTIKARRAVILACGGFEAGHEMQRQYWQDDQVLPAVGLGNTGDGIRMAQAAGADLWHMWHYHGGYGFRHPDPAYPVGIRMKRLP